MMNLEWRSIRACYQFGERLSALFASGQLTQAQRTRLFDIKRVLNRTHNFTEANAEYVAALERQYMRIEA